jgi:Bifunctional DNA primase/polymerase, N-terminal
MTNTDSIWCQHWHGAARRYCHATDRVRSYPIGPRCPQHTPAAIAGRPEPPSTMLRRPDSQALLRSAIEYAARGWHVFPVRPGEKRPAFPDHDTERCTGRDPRCRNAGAHLGWEQRATTDPDRIRRAWSAAPYNIGVACGPSGLVVVDLDKPKPGKETPPAEWATVGVHDGWDVFAAVCDHAGQPMPLDTYTVATGRGGTHLYFRHPSSGPHLRNTNGGTRGSLGWLIDTRAHGGYVLGAGSLVNGRPYTLAHDGEAASLPDWLAERLTPKPLPPQRPVTVRLKLGVGKRAAYLDKAVRASLDAIAAAPDGALNRTLYGASVALGQLVAGGALDADQTEALLLGAASEAGHPAAAARRTIRSGFRAGANRPRSLAGVAA